MTRWRCLLELPAGAMVRVRLMVRFRCLVELQNDLVGLPLPDFRHHSTASCRRVPVVAPSWPEEQDPYLLLDTAMALLRMVSFTGKGPK